MQTQHNKKGGSTIKEVDDTGPNLLQEEEGLPKPKIKEKLLIIKRFNAGIVKILVILQMNVDKIRVSERKQMNKRLA